MESLMIDARYTVDTPENIEFAYDVAGIGSRFLAAIIDTLILILLQIALAIVMGVLLGQASEIVAGLDSILIAVWFILSFIFLWGYYILFELFWNGQCPGKRVVGLRVVREGGRPVTFVASAIRNLVRFVDFLPGFYGLGVVVMFIDQRARRLGDLASGTLVVKERHAVSLASLTTRATPIPPPRQPGGALIQPQLPNLHLLTDNDYNLIQEFLRRRRELGQASRTQLGRQLADGIRVRLELAPINIPEPFLEQVVYEYRLSRQQAEVSRSPSDGQNPASDPTL